MLKPLDPAFPRIIIATMNTSPTPSAKRRLRRQLRRRREALSGSVTATASRAVTQRVQALPEYAAARVVHSYVSSLGNELDTRALIRCCLEQGRRVIVPVVRPGSKTLGHAEIESLDELQPDRWYLLTPPPGAERWLYRLAEIDLILVPGVAFDPQGNRLGLGGGYYDRFLAQIRAPRAGLTYDQLLLPELTPEPHDIRMDLVITPSRTIRCCHA